MARNKLARLLLESDKAAETSSGSNLSQFGLEQLTNISRFLKGRIAQWSPEISDYDPLFEIAKIAFLTTDERLAFSCHSELARYQYPQIRSLEVQAKDDKEVKIKVELAGYAKGSYGSGPYPPDTEIEDIETEGDLEAEEPDKAEEMMGDRLENIVADSRKQTDKGGESRSVNMDRPAIDKNSVKRQEAGSDYLDTVFIESSKKGRGL